MAEEEIFRKINKLKYFSDLPADSPLTDYTLLNTALLCEQKDVALFLIDQGCPVNCESNIIGNTPLHYAVRFQDDQLIQKLISKGASLTCQNHKGDTPLHMAIMFRDPRIVDLLLSYIDSTEYSNPSNDFGLTHMHIACMRNKVDVVESFIEKEVELEIAINFDAPLWPGYTPLHFAVEFSCLEVMQLLLSHYAYTQTEDALEVIPERLAYLRYQNASMIYYFFECPDYVHDSRFQRKLNFHAACLEGDKDTVQKYIKYGGNLDGKLFPLCIHQYDTPLHCAAISCSVDVVKLLLEKGADINCVNEYHMTPLITAFYYSDDSVSENLLISYCDFKKYGNITDNNGISYFHIACHRGDVKTVKYFLEEGVNVNSQINGNSLIYPSFTPLFFAVQFERCKIVKLLLNHSADIGLCNAENETVFDLASFYRCDMINIFLQSGIDINNIKNKKNDNPFHILCPKINYTLMYMIDGIKTIKKLYDLGCDINHQNIDGNTPLHTACQYGTHFKFIQIFLDLGSDINIENDEGQTPFVLLRQSTFLVETVVKLMLHTEKLNAIGYYVSRQNIQYLSEFISSLEISDIDQETIESISEASNRVKDSLRIIKNIQITNYTSMYDVLFADANKMALLCENKLFLTALDKLENETPADRTDYSYVNLLRLQLRKGKSRRALLQPAIVSLKNTFKIQLPHFCLEMITSYLSNDDLECLL